MDAKKIREKREELGLTQSELATLIGVSLRTIQNYEKDGVIPSSKYEILRNVLNTSNINITGDNNIANTGVVGEPEQIYGNPDFLRKRIKEVEEENAQLKKDKAILQEFVTFLQNKK